MDDLRWVIFILILLYSFPAFARLDGGSPTIRFRDESGSVNGRPKTIVVTDGALTDNGDRTFSLDVISNKLVSGDITRITEGVSVLTYDNGTLFTISYDAYGKPYSINNDSFHRLQV